MDGVRLRGGDDRRGHPYTCIEARENQRCANVTKSGPPPLEVFELRVETEGVR